MVNTRKMLTVVA